MTTKNSETAVSTYTPESMPAAYQQFLQANPIYSQTSHLDDLRRTDYQRLDAQDQVYLDYTGGGLHGESQIDKHFAMLRTYVFGNPHSANPTSLAMTERSKKPANISSTTSTPAQTTSPCFTANASGALKHIGESYPFQTGGQYLLTFDNHNSVNGIREYARSRGAAFTYVPLPRPDLRIDRPKLEDDAGHCRPESPARSSPSPPNPTSPASSIPWTTSSWPTA